MDNENKLPLSKIIENIFAAFFKIVNDIKLLAMTEARLATQSMKMIVVLSLLQTLLAVSTWICLQGLLVVYLISLNVSLLLALLTVTALNVLLMGVIFLVILHLKKNFSFNATRRQISNSKDLFKDSMHE
jgi:hypothetical protein